MFTRHVHSAIGGGRPLAHDFAKVSEGIAASLRAFSSSVRRSAEGDGMFSVSFCFHDCLLRLRYIRLRSHNRGILLVGNMVY